MRAGALLSQVDHWLLFEAGRVYRVLKIRCCDMDICNPLKGFALQAMSDRIHLPYTVYEWLSEYVFV